MDTGVQNPLAEQEKQIEQVLAEVGRLRKKNEELNSLVSGLKEIIGIAHQQACEETMKPDYGSSLP